MHEWAIAESIVRYIVNNYRGRTIVGVTIAVGRLQNIDKDILVFNVKELLRIEGFREVEVKVRDIGISLRCRFCNYEWSVNPEDLGEDISEMIHFIPESIHAYVKCPKCNSRDFEIVSGRGVYIEEIVEVIET
ncbi:MAG: hydrogenase nickel incorporation protein HypA [Sulfolobales archaeon]